MPLKFKADIRGLKELEQTMRREFPASVSRSVTLAALRDSAKPMRDRAQSYVPVQSGALRESIGFKTVAKRRSTFASVLLGYRSNEKAWLKWATYHGRGANFNDPKSIGRIRHGHLIEFGFKHVRSGKYIPGKHPLRTGFDVSYYSFQNRFYDSLKKSIERRIKTRMKGIYTKRSR